MPYIEHGRDGDRPAVQKWHLALKNALIRRLAPERLEAPLKQLAAEYRAQGDEVASVLMSFRATIGADDPLLFRYARLLLVKRHMSAGNLLLALLKQESSGKYVHPSVGLPTCEERMLTLLLELQLQGGLPSSPFELRRLTYAITRWLNVVCEHETRKQMETAGLHTLDAFAYGKYEALGQLAISVFGQPEFKAIAKQPWWEKRRPSIVQEMRNFDARVLQWMQSAYSGRLQALTQMPPFVETDEKGRPVLTHEQVIQTILQDGNINPVQSRAGLFVWLDACLSGKPTTMDEDMFAYLSTRYPGDNQMLTVQLVHAAFDVLTNAILRHDNAHELKCLRSFACNKLPVLLAMLASIMGQMTMETCLQTAFMSIAIDPIPPMEAGSMEATEALRRTRLECLQACALHGIASEATISAIVQEPPMALPKTVKYTKESLLAQCTHNVSRLESLVGELQTMSGNAGVVAGCIVDLIRHLCETKDTMSLKTASNILIRRIKDFDIVLQYTRPDALLAPLCILLNDWTHDQDQAEFTPAYEEFASVLLLTLAILHRYGFTAADIGLSGTETLVFTILDHGSRGIPPAELNVEQGTQLSKWLEGLFAVDEQGETSGISDEVMRQCPPQAFYKLVPTLIEQSIAACKFKQLSLETFKSGLELLLEPFLLPSLIGTLNWLTGHSWEDHGDADILLQALEKLLKPATSSPETQSMHRAVMVVVAEPLKRSLEDLLHRRPDNKAAHRLAALLKPYTDTTCSRVSGRSELERWATADAGDFETLLSTYIRQLVAWASGLSSAPPGYTNRLMLAACQLVGPSQVLNFMAQEIQNTPYPNTGTVLDVCTSILCAPTHELQDVRQDLALTISDTQNLLDRPSGIAAALVRLSRTVQTQMAVHPMDLQFALPQVQQTASDQMLQELGLVDAAAAPGVTEPGAAAAAQITDADLEAALGVGEPLDLAGPHVDGLTDPAAPNAVHFDQSQDFFADLNMDMSNQPQASNGMMAQAGSMGGGQQPQEEDIFAGLDMGMSMGDDFDFA